MKRLLRNFHKLVLRCDKRAVALALCGAIAPPASATPLDVVNEVRRSGCGREPLAALTRSAKLDEAARRVANGAKLHDALPATRYRANEAMLLHVHGLPDDPALRRILQLGYCEEIRNGAVREAGFARARGALWFVFAAPFAAPAADEAPAIAQQVLALVNEARAAPRRCGAREFGAAPPLRLSDALSRAALEHSREMAAGAPFAHRSPRTGSPRHRVERAGYVPAIVGENIAAGSERVDDTVGGWLNSPGHCASIMDPRFVETGVAYAANADGDEIYWTQVFAAPGA